MDIPSHLLSVLHNLPQLFHNVARVEAHFAGVPQLSTPHRSPFLWNVTSQEDDIVLATIRIREIVERNLSLLRGLHADYSVFAQMHRRVQSINTQELVEHSDVAMCRAEMETARAMAVRIAAETHDKAYLRLFCVSCRHVNATLLAGLAQWTNNLLHAFQEHTSRLNAELRHEYKDVAARLTKKPMDLYELVDAEEFVAFLKATKVSELQSKADSIQERIRFLLFERGSVRIDGPGPSNERDGTATRGNSAGNEGQRAAALSVQTTYLAPFFLSPDLLTTTVKTIKWRSLIDKLLHDAEVSLVNERARIETVFLARRTRFLAEIDEFDNEVKGFSKKGDLRHAATYVVQLAKMKDALFSFRKTMEAIVEEEIKLQWKTTDFSMLDDIAEEMEPYEQLWKTAREFREMSSRWLRANVFELESSEGMQTLHQMLAVVSNVSKLLHLNSAVTAITAEMVKKQIADFRENARLVGAISNPSMKARHLKEVAALVGVPVNPEEPVTLLKLLENGAFDHLSRILDISHNATLEKQVENALVEIAVEWEDVQFGFKPAKKQYGGASGCQTDQRPSAVPTSLTSSDGASTTFSSERDVTTSEPSMVLLRSCVEETQRVVEDNQARLQSLLCMPHAVPFAQEIASWLQFTQNVQRLVDLLSDAGRVWKALSPLFAANVVEASSKEAKLFATADQLYRRIVSQIQQQPLCQVVIPRTLPSKADTGGTASSPADEMLADLRACLELLEAAKENVRVGLDGKRLAFARLCFLSDLELVTVLSCRNASGGVLLDSRDLWANLSSCFPGIHSVHINASREITAVSSSVGETFSLGTPISIASVAMTTWLGKVETAMVTMLQASIRASISDSSRKEFRKWCLLWPEQVLFVAIQQTWTLQCEQALRKPSGQERLSAWEAISASLREKHSSVVKEVKAATHAHIRVSLSNVLLLLCHLQDVSVAAAQELRLSALDGQQQATHAQDAASSSTSSSTPSATYPMGVGNLAWLAQPRYYFEENTFSVKMLAAAPIPYGFEYLGNGSPTFFVTPLTLRCFQAIAQAATVLSRGTCLQGAAGGGKTVLVSALAQTCGRLHVRLECGNALSFGLLLQFVRGAAACGAWLAMENFQVVECVQASAVAYLCAQAMDAIAAKQSHSTLLGDKMRVKRGCHFSILLQGGIRVRGSVGGACDSYRADGARFFFKIIEVPSPDIEVVTEHLLQQGKFVNAPVLAKLIFIVLNVFERGFTLVHGDREYRVDAMKTGFLNLRFVRRVVKRAVELSWIESTAQSFAVSAVRSGPSGKPPNANVYQNTAVITARMSSNDALDSHEVEKLEHKLICLALREKLNAVTPAAHHEVVEFLLRDVAANSLIRELRAAESFLFAPRLVALGAAAETPLDHQLEEEQQHPMTIEEAVEHTLRMRESAWVAFGVPFGLKIIQLLQTMKATRAVVVSGSVQSGKTALYNALARTLSHISAKEQAANRAAKARNKPNANPTRFSSIEMVALTRSVVLVPRALTLDNLFGTAVDHFGNTLLANLIRDAKHCHEHTQVQTWLVLDGNLASSWCETLLYLVDDTQDDGAGHHKGLRLASGKRVLLPRCMRLVLETTQLSNVSPSFLTRVGVVSVGEAATHEWRGVYQAWKVLHKDEFTQLASEIFGIVDVLLEETVEAALEFVEKSFQRGFPQLRLARFKSLLALFHSSMRQSWAKMTSMVSSKQRQTAIHCFYLQAIVWGIGSTSDTHERQLFHEFLRHWIIHGPHSSQSSLKRVLVLFFPSGSTGTAQSASVQTGATTLLSHGANRALNAATTTKDVIYAFGFSVEYGLKWMRWTEFYEIWLQSQASLSAAGGSNVRGHSGDSGEIAVAALMDLVVPTGPMAAAICQMNQLLMSNYPVLLDGVSDSGKSVCGSAWLTLNDAFSTAQATAEAMTQPSLGGASDSDPSAATLFQQVFVGYSTTSAQVLEQIAVMLERPARDHNAAGTKPDTTLGSTGHHGEYRRMTVLNPNRDASSRTRKRMSFVFVDDLHCLNAETTMDSAIELLRMLVEQREVVHPSLNQVVSCANILPFAALQANYAFHTNSDSHRDIVRLTSRFVRVPLPSLTDAELSSICLATVSPMSNASAQQLSAPPAAAVTLGDSQEAHQIVSMIIKASIMLFRFLSGEFSSYAAKTPFDPSKLHYAFRVHEISDVVHSVCCDNKRRLTFAEKPLLARLWCHESARTFGDRLVDPKEISIFHQHARDIALGSFSLTPAVFFPEASVDAATAKDSAQSHLWLANHLHFTFIGESSGAGFMEGYREVSDMQKVELSVERNMMAMYRANLGSESLEIVICGYVIQHVLRLSRLLRSNGQNVLLIGSRGRKMVTITRLAAFICKKVSLVYSVPATDKDFEMATWKRELKGAVLRSVRNRDERIVFIVKDVNLSSVDHYDAVERFVAGAKLSSDFLSYDDLDDHILATLRDLVVQDHEEGHPDTSSGKAAPQSVLSSKASVLEYFFAQVRERFQMVIILSEQPRSDGQRTGVNSSGTLPSILWKTPQILKHCAINHFGDWPEESLTAIALKRFAMSSDVGKDRAQQLSQVAAQIYLCTQKCLERCSRDPGGASSEQNNENDGGDQEKATAGNSSTSPTLRLSWYDRLPSLRLDPSMLLDQIGLFLKFSGRLQRDITTNKEKYEAGLAFLDTSEQILATEHAQTQMLQPEMKKRTEMTRRMSGTLEREKLTSDKLSRALELAISLAETQRERLANVEAEYHDLVRDSMIAFQSVQTKVGVFQVAKFEEQEADEATSTQDEGPASLPTVSQDDGGAESSSTVEDIAGASEQQDAAINGTDATRNDDGSAESRPSAVEVVEAVVVEIDPERELRQYRRALIKSFVSVKPVPAALKQLAECLGLIFSIQPVEARDELDLDEVFMDYWESVTAHMKTKEFWNDLAAYDVEARVNDKILARVLPICTTPDFEVELFVSLHELAGTLCEWVKAWSSFARDIIFAGPKFAQLMQEREAFAGAQSSLQARKLELETQQNTNVEVSALRHLSELERKDIETRLQDNASTLQMATSVWKLLASSRKKWRTAYEYYTAFSAEWMGDLIIGTSTIAYASCTNARVRAFLRSQWSVELRRHCLVHAANSSRMLHALFLVDDLRLSRWGLDGLPVDDPSAVESAVMTTSCYRFPLLIDPYGIATEWITKCEAGNKLLTLNCSAVLDDASADAAWKTLGGAAKNHQTVLLTNLSEESAFHLRSLLGAKRRSVFEAVNRDISSLSGTGSNSSSAIARYSAGNGGSATHYPCWFHVPSRTYTESSLSHTSHHRHTPQQQQRAMSATVGAQAPTTVEFGSESWRVYFVYSRTDSVPRWMLSYSSQLSIVRFDFSPAFIETQCVSRVVEAYGKQHLLTESQALRLDVISCQEQIDAIENEILDFFSTEQAEHVYADVSKSLRIIGNRSAMHTLMSSKTESESKILATCIALDRYRAIVDRAVDVAFVFRDISFVVEQEKQCFEGSDLFALPWVWTLLARSFQLCDPHATIQDVIRVYTARVQSYVSASLSDENQIVFMFLLALRLHARATHSSVRGSSGTNESGESHEFACAVRHRGDVTGIHHDTEVLYRVLQVLLCSDENETRNVCASAPAQLVALRPELFSPQKWRAVCYLADASPELREFVMRHAEQKHKTAAADMWKELAGIDGFRQVTHPLSELSSVVRLCTASVIHNDLLLAEIEHFSASELIVLGSNAHLPAPPQQPLRDTGTHDNDDETTAQNDEAAPAAVRTRMHANTGQVVGADTLFELWHGFSSSRIPITVNCTADANFLHQVERVALKAKMTIDRQMFHDTFASANSDKGDDVFARRLLAAMQNGHWAVLSSAHTTPSRLARLENLFESLDDQQLHPDFRLWISSSAASTDESSRGWRSERSEGRTDCFMVSKLAIYTHEQQGVFSLKRSLSRTFALLADDPCCQEFVSVNTELLLKRIGLLHTVLTAQDHFGFAHWKSPERRNIEFSDGELRAMIRAVTHPRVKNISALSDSCASDTLAQALRDAALSIYGSSLQSDHDRLLLECCVDLILPPSCEVAGSVESSQVAATPTTDTSPVHTIPEIACMLHSVESLSWEQIVSGGIQSLWRSEELGPDVSSSGVVMSDTRVRDPLRLRSRRRQRIVEKLALLLEESGFVPLSTATRTRTPGSNFTGLITPRSQSPSALASPIETVLNLALELDGVVAGESEAVPKTPHEYKKPLSHLIRHELAFLNTVRLAVIRDIRRMEAVRTHVCPCLQCLVGMWCLDTRSFLRLAAALFSTHRFTLALNRPTKLPGHNFVMSSEVARPNRGYIDSSQAVRALSVATPVRLAAFSMFSYTACS